MTAPATTARRWLPALMTGLLAPALAAAFPASARASATDLSCTTGTRTVTFNPGLTDTPKVVHSVADVDYTGCVSTDKTIKSGAIDQSFNLTLACTDLLGTFPATNVITWSNGRTSTDQVTYTVEYVEGQLVTTGTGTVTAGEFTGDHVIEAGAQVADLLKCLTPGGLTQIGPGPDTITLTP